MWFFLLLPMTSPMWSITTAEFHKTSPPSSSWANFCFRLSLGSKSDLPFPKWVTLWPCGAWPPVVPRKWRRTRWWRFPQIESKAASRGCRARKASSKLLEDKRCLLPPVPLSLSTLQLSSDLHAPGQSRVMSTYQSASNWRLTVYVKIVVLDCLKYECCFKVLPDRPSNHLLNGTYSLDRSQSLFSTAGALVVKTV